MIASRPSDGTVLVGTHGHGVYSTNIVTAVQPGSGAQTPDRFGLSQNYPNPFNPETSIRYTLPQAGHVKITIYSVTGAVVRTLVDRSQGAGMHFITWDGANDRGIPVNSGVYFYTLRSGNINQTRKMALIR